MNIALFIDGTWNQPSHDHTNVYKLFAHTIRDHGQSRAYLPGVGTENEQILTSEWQVPGKFKKVLAAARRLDLLPRRLFGGATGWGMGNLIRNAYRYLCSVYTPGDRIYLFGFSRGAFAARSLAGFAEAVGLLLKGRDSKRNVDIAYHLYEHGGDPLQSPLREFLQAITDLKEPGIEGPNVMPIHLIALWDTVGALGLSGRLSRFSAPYTEFHKTELPRNVTHARHALALHELRGQFEPLLWSRQHPNNAGQSLEQVWFTGAHADVGGGYKRNETNWSDAALDWVANQASSLGLRLTPTSLPDCNVRAPIHHQIRGAFRWSSPVKREVLIERHNLSPKTTSTYSVHASVLKRLRVAGTPDYKFKTEVNAALREIDEETLRMLFELNLDAAGCARGWWTQITPIELEALMNWADQLITEPAGLVDPERLLAGVCTTALFSCETFEQNVNEVISHTRLLIAGIKLSPSEQRYDYWRTNLGRVVRALSDAKSRLPSKHAPLLDSTQQRASTAYEEFKLELVRQRRPPWRRDS